MERAPCHPRIDKMRRRKRNETRLSESIIECGRVNFAGIRTEQSEQW
jgi:hypothetical protein